MKIYTIRDIARLSGVSVTTVSRVLNHRPDVNPQTREKVEQVMAECHFVGNANARSLKQADTETIALILRGRENPFLNSLAEAMLQYTHGLTPAFLTEFIDEKADEFQTAVQLWHEKRVKGFIFVGSRIDERAQVLEGMDLPMVFATVNADKTALPRAASVFIDERAQVLEGMDLPMVFATVNADKTALPRAASVFIDDRRMGYEAMRVLLNAGHRKIAVFGGARVGDDSLALRYAGAMAAMQEAGVPFEDKRFIETRFSLKGAYDTTRAFFATQSDTTAVFCMSDTVAMGVIRALTDMGRRVPEDVGVIGFDGIEMSKFFVPRITTIEQPIDEIARESVRVLMDMLENGRPPRHIVVPAKVQMRESV